MTEALTYAFDSVMGDIGKSSISGKGFVILVILLGFYGIFYAAILGGTRKTNAAYKYFKENPHKLSMSPITTIYSICPHCGASNTAGGETCQYCGSLLKKKEGNVQYVKPNDSV